MKIIKTKITATVTAIFLLLLFNSCEKTDTNFNSNGEWNTQDTYVLQGYATEGGYYYMRTDSDSNEIFLSYFDEDSKTSVTLCDKIGCKHNDRECHAYMPGTPRIIFVANQKLYTIEKSADAGNSMGETLVQRELDGRNREEKLILLQDKMDAGYVVQVNDYKVVGNTFYYCASKYTSHQETGGMIDEEMLFRKVDLSTFQETEFYKTDENQAHIILAMNQNQMLFQEWNVLEMNSQDMINFDAYDKKEYFSQITIKIKLYDQQEQSVKTLIEENAWELQEALSVYQNYIYLNYWDENHENNIVKQYDMSTGESKEVLKVTGSISNCAVLNPSELLIADQDGWRLYRMVDFSQVPIGFLGDDVTILQYMPDGGLILDRVLEKKEEEEDFYLVKKRAYSYLSKDDFKDQNPNFVDFYFQEFS